MNKQVNTRQAKQDILETTCEQYSTLLTVITTGGKNIYFFLLWSIHSGVLEAFV